MKEFIKSLEKEIRNNLEVNNITIIDNSYKHKKHKFFDKNKCHLYLEIESSYLKNLKTLDAHRLIMKLLGEKMKSKIHALEIKIK
jgi:BolA family transcriptional regulator, general stress-responsive regulator